MCYLSDTLGVETEINPLEVGLLVRTKGESSIRNTNDALSQEKLREY